MNSAVSSGDYTCKDCSAQFDSMASVLRHELTHIVGRGNNGPAAGMKRHRKGGRPNNNKKRRNGPKNVGGELDPIMAQLEGEVRNALRNCQEGSELNVLCRIFQNDPSVNSQNFIRVTSVLRGLLEKGVRGHAWEIHPFGSMITGMAFKDSDIDFFIKPAKREPFRQHFNIVYRLLNMSGQFDNVVPIRAARVPIIKCRHRATGLSLDINMSSCHGVFSSNFIAQMFTYDARIHPLMFIIKIWAKSWGFTNTNRMSNYCLLILVVYYLQAMRNPILPPISEFMLNTQPEMVDGINFAFNKYYPNQTSNRSNIRELIEGFFRFYGEFPFLTHVICPYLGKSINREEFTDDSVYFPEYRRQVAMMNEKHAELEANGSIGWCRDVHPGNLVVDTTLAIQDPFNLNTNIAKGVRPIVFNVFHGHVLHARRICNERGNTSAKLLVRLFYEAPTENPELALSMAVPIKNEPGTAKASNPAQSTPNEFTCRLTPIETELFHTRLYLRNKDPAKTYEKIEIDKAWCELMVKFLRNIFADLYKFKLKEKRNKREQYHIRTQVEVFADTWTHRRSDIKKDYAAFLREQTDYGASVTPSPEALFIARLSVEVNTIDFSELNIKMEAGDAKKKIVGVFFRDLTSRVRSFLKAYFEKLTSEPAN